MYDCYQSLDLSKITINTLIHKLKLTLNVGDLQGLKSKLKSVYRLSADHRLHTGNFERKSTYEGHSTKIDLIYKPRSYNAFFKKVALLVLYHPQTESMYQVASILNRLSTYYKLSSIEFAWDLYSPFTFFLYDMLKSHLFLRYQRGHSNQYENTYYTNNIRKSTKGVRVYLRPKDSNLKKYVRLELELHRQKIKKLNLNIPLTPEMVDIDFKNYFDFRKIDFAKFYRSELRRNREQILRLNVKSPRGAQTLKCHIESWVTAYADEPLMKIVERMRSKLFGVPNFSRFLVPIGDLNMLVENAAHEQRFGLL